MIRPVLYFVLSPFLPFILSVSSLDLLEIRALVNTYLSNLWTISLVRVMLRHFYYHTQGIAHFQGPYA